MTLKNADLADYATTSSQEWLSVNGQGGFASGTVAGVQTRRYHALLIAALRPPTEHRTLLSQIHDTVTVDGVPFDLHTGRYADGTVHPQGWRHITEFTPFPVPTWHYQLPNNIEIIKRIFLAPEKNTVYVTYTRSSARPGNPLSVVTLTLEPLVAWKDYHAEMQPWDGFPTAQGFTVGGYEIQPTPDAPNLRLLARGAKWTRAGWWHRDNYHEREAERGLDCIEQLYCPATVTANLAPGEMVTFIGTIETAEPDDVTVVLAQIIKQNNEVCRIADIPDNDDVLRTLVTTANQFIIRGKGIRTTIIAGYPWFTDWGRDTMIALPGLCLVTGRFEIARDILNSYAEFVSEGMIPNRFPDEAYTPDYNTVDATLWYVHACNEYATASRDSAFRERVAPTIKDIIAAHERGTRYGIGVDDSDGLLAAGEPGAQLTWMDAKVGDYVVTPRHGKPVEINALWINALLVAADFTGDEEYKTKAARATQSFREKFVRADGNGLYDVIRPYGAPDEAIRPNQIIAAAIPASLLTDEQAKATLDTVTRELLTPYGLRTLSPADPSYRPRYEGDGWSRDTAYHQGTVWPWLLGPYADAHRRIYGDAPDISALIDNLRYYGIGGIAEVFDGNAPQRPNGCPWQAWSISAVLHIYRSAMLKSL